MKVSIMITCYNNIDCIDNAITSVLKQEIPYSYEVLIGDDGSVDGTIDKIMVWKEKYPHIIKVFIMKRDESKEIAGNRAARNRANLLNNSKGEFLAFLDGDDLFTDNNKIALQVQELEMSSNKSCACAAHNIVANDEVQMKRYEMVSNTVLSGIITSKEYWRTLYFHTNTILFRRKCCKLLLATQYKDYLNDNFITYLIIQHGSIYYSNRVMAQYNITGNGLWTGKSRVIGCFRNIILYDMEKEVNHVFASLSFKRHLSDIMYIKNNYRNCDSESVLSLISSTDSKRIPTATLLSKLTDLSANEYIKQKFIYFKATILSYMLNLRRIPIYIKRLLKTD